MSDIESESTSDGFGPGILGEPVPGELEPGFVDDEAAVVPDAPNNEVFPPESGVTVLGVDTSFPGGVNCVFLLRGKLLLSILSIQSL